MDRLGAAIATAIAQAEAALIFAAFLAVIIVFVVIGAIAAAKRRKELMAFAHSNGLTFDPGRDQGMNERFAQFDCLRQGSNRYAYNRMAGQWNGRQLLAFDYHYETYSHDSKGHRRTNHHHFSAVILESSVPLEPLLIRAEGFFDKVKEFFGFDDIDFESAEFSRQFYVKAANRKWAYDVIHARTIELLLASPRFTIQFGPRQAIAWRSGTFGTQEFSAATALVQGILDRLPDYVVKQQMDQPR